MDVSGVGGLTQDDKIWQDVRPGWVAGHLLFWWTLAQGLAPKAKKWKNVGNALDSCEPGVTNWPVTTLRLVSHRRLCSLYGDRHVRMYTIRDNWRTFQFCQRLHSTVARPMRLPRHPDAPTELTPDQMSRFYYQTPVASKFTGPKPVNPLDYHVGLGGQCWTPPWASSKAKDVELKEMLQMFWDIIIVIIIFVY